MSNTKYGKRCSYCKEKAVYSIRKGAITKYRFCKKCFENILGLKG